MLAGPSSSLSTTTNNTRSFTDIDPAAFSSLATPMVSPSPAPARSKTNAFFSSSFTTPGPALARPPKQEQHSPKPKSLTAAFFGSSSTPTPPPSTPPPKKPSRNFLNLDLSDSQLSLPVTTSFTSTPKPSAADSDRNPDSALSEPTPKPAHSSVKAVVEGSSSNVADTLGTEPDAEVLSTKNSSLSKLSASSQAYIASHIPRSPSTYPHQFIPSIGEQGQNLYPTGDEEELAAGMIIRSFLPSSSSSTSQSDNTTSHVLPASLSPLPISVASSSSTETLSQPKRSNTIPVTLRLIRPLGQGSFSSVWLAEDLSPTSLLLRSRRSLRDLKRKASAGGVSSSSHTPSYGSLARRPSEKKPKALSSTSHLMRKLRGGVSGTRPQFAKKAVDLPPVPPLPHYLVPGGLPPTPPTPSSPGYEPDLNDGRRFPMGSYLGEPEISLSRASSVSGRSDVETEDEDSVEGVIRKASVKSMGSIGGTVSRSGSERSVSSTRSGKLGNKRGRLVAVKLTSRGAVERKDKDKNRVRTSQEIAEERERDRTRVSFVREVEVLKHISHPNITPLLSHLTTRTHHVLVLPYLPGGDLLGLVNDEVAWNNLTESTVRRIFAELCKAVSWMHSVGLVHRDIKLENVLLTMSLSEAALLENDHQRSGSEDNSHSGTRQSDDEGLPVFGEKVTDSSPTSYAFAAAESSNHGSSPSSPTGSSFHPSHPQFSRYPSESSTSISSGSGFSSWYLSSDSDSKTSMSTDTSLLDSRSHTIMPTYLDRKPNPQNIPPPSHPLIKLTDFGLSRFIDPAKPLLTTRCGSEAYAAPELVMSGGRAGVASGGSRWGEDGGYASEAGRRRDSTSSGGYDARETDAWACGVVLYALVARRLPFGEGPGEALIGVPGGNARRPAGASERRQWLMKIARGDWQWPTVDAPEASSSGDEELQGVHLAESEGAKRVASKLMIRDPTRRYRLKDLWDDEWVAGCGVVGATMSQLRGISPSPGNVIKDLPVDLQKSGYMVKIHDDSGVEVTRKSIPHANGFEREDIDDLDVPIRSNVNCEFHGDNEEEDEEEDDGAEDGWLVDKEGIKNIAREEVQ